MEAKQATSADVQNVPPKRILKLSELLQTQSLPAADAKQPWLLVLDIDGTLIRTIGAKEMDQKGVIQPRAHLTEFLVWAHKMEFTLAIWSAAHPDWVQRVLDAIWPFEKVGAPSFVFCRDRCTERKEFVVKRLHTVWQTFQQFSPERTVILDDNEDTYQDNDSNAIPALPFTDVVAQKNDLFLVVVLLVLRDLRTVEDVRTVRILDRMSEKVKELVCHISKSTDRMNIL